MKGRIEFLFFLPVLVLTGCGDPVIPPAYTVRLPPLPAPWEEMMGSASWRLVWTDPQGGPRTLEIRGGGEAVIETVSEWAVPVLAFPFWPGRGISPGEMRPAGGILPFDAAGSELRLSWRGGVDAWYYRKLTEAGAAAGGNAGAGTPGKRRPEYFDWPRFRGLLSSDAIPEAIREDPWQADWDEIAAQTVKSGFDRRRITVRAGEELLVSREAMAKAATSAGATAESSGSLDTGGPFAGPSPFAKPLFPEPGAGFRFTVGPRADTYVSPAGILRVSGKTWIYYSF
jgi:hypothetical protein